MALSAIESTNIAMMERTILSDGYKTHDGFNFSSMQSPFAKLPSFSTLSGHYPKAISAGALDALLSNPIKFVPATNLTTEDEMARILRSRRKQQDTRDATRRRMSAPYPASAQYPITRPRGFPNPNNLCYRNAAVQALLHAPKFVSWLELGHAPGVEEHHSCSIEENACATCATRALALTYWDIESNNNDTRCTQLLNRLHRLLINNGWYHKGQQDVEEYLFFLLNGMSMNLPSDPSFPDLTMIRALFGIDLQSQKRCSRCGTESFLPLQTELMLQVNIRPQISKGNLKSYLRKYFNDSISGYRCDNPICVEDRDRSMLPLDKKRKYYLTSVPDVLLISLKRFTQNEGKLMDKVPYPQHLDLRPYMKPDTGSSSNNYELRAVVKHIGVKPIAGHYITTIRSEQRTARGSARWFEINDKIITEKTLKSALSLSDKETAYILVYTKADAVEFADETIEHQMLDSSGKRSVPVKRKRTQGADPADAASASAAAAAAAADS